MDAIGAIRVQRSVLQQLDPEHNKPREITFIDTYGKKMREIIDTFSERTGRDPTPADIIWCLGFETCEDPHKLMQCMVPYDAPEQK